MSAIVQALQTISTHRDLVPAYYHRPSGMWIVGGTTKTAGGAVVVDNATGSIIHACPSKRDALALISSN